MFFVMVWPFFVSHDFIQIGLRFSSPNQKNPTKLNIPYLQYKKIPNQDYARKPIKPTKLKQTTKLNKP